MAGRRILFATAEVKDIKGTGGLGTVSKEFTMALRDAGDDARIVMPYYEPDMRKVPEIKTAIEKGSPIATFEVDMGKSYLVNGRKETAECKVYYVECTLSGKKVPVYFIDNPRFFGSRHRTDERPAGYCDDPERFGFFGQAVVKLLEHMKEKIEPQKPEYMVPDVIQINDWHAGVIPMIMREKHKGDRFFEQIGTYYTIHNFTYSGEVTGLYGVDDCPSKSIFKYTGLEDLPQREKDRIIKDKFLPSPKKKPDDTRITFGGCGLNYSDVAGAVSSNYRNELCVSEGAGFQERFQARNEENLIGIVNGVSHETNNPVTEEDLLSGGFRQLEEGYNEESLYKWKLDCKKAFREFYDFKYPDPNVNDEDVPLLVIIGRIDNQKNHKLLVKKIDEIMKLNDGKIQIFIGGPENAENGKKPLTDLWNEIAKKKEYLGKIKIIEMNSMLNARRAYAAGDIMLMPSDFEPCGLGQLEASLYGCVPVVTEVGGLKDTIFDWDSEQVDSEGIKRGTDKQDISNFARHYHGVGFTIPTRPRPVEKATEEQEKAAREKEMGDGIVNGLKRAVALFSGKESDARRAVLTKTGSANVQNGVQIQTVDNGKTQWKKAQFWNITSDFSWNRPMKKYQEAFDKIVKERNLKRFYEIENAGKQSVAAEKEKSKFKHHIGLVEFLDRHAVYIKKLGELSKALEKASTKQEEVKFEQLYAEKSAVSSKMESEEYKKEFCDLFNKLKSDNGKYLAVLSRRVELFDNDVTIYRDRVTNFEARINAVKDDNKELFIRYNAYCNNGFAHIKEAKDCFEKIRDNRRLLNDIDIEYKPLKDKYDVALRKKSESSDLKDKLLRNFDVLSTLFAKYERAVELKIFGNEPFMEASFVKSLSEAVKSNTRCINSVNEKTERWIFKLKEQLNKSLEECIYIYDSLNGHNFVNEFEKRVDRALINDWIKESAVIETVLKEFDAMKVGVDIVPAINEMRQKVMVLQGERTQDVQQALGDVKGSIQKIRRGLSDQKLKHGVRDIVIDVHYSRYDGDYAGWKLVKWGVVQGSNAKAGGIVNFSADDKYGKVARLRLDIDTIGDLEKIGFALQKEDHRYWLERGYDKDSMIPLKDLIEKARLTGKVDLYVSQSEPSKFNFEHNKRSVRGFLLRKEENIRILSANIEPDADDLNKDIATKSTDKVKKCDYSKKYNKISVEFDRKFDPEKEEAILTVGDRQVNLLPDLTTWSSASPRKMSFTIMMGDEICPYELGNSNEIHKIKNYKIKIVDKFNHAKRIDIQQGNAERTISVEKLFGTEEFKNLFTYKGKDLGVTHSKQKTSFRVWAPTADIVKVKLYKCGSKKEDLDKEGKCYHTYSMKRSINGTWTLDIDEKGLAKLGLESLDGVFYTYQATVNGILMNEVVDPYAKAGGLDGERGMIVDDKRTLPDGNWQSDIKPAFRKDFSEFSDADIYEIHTRNFTIHENSGVESSKKGTFAGLVQKGTTYKGVKTGFDHIKEMGYTHVQLLPINDFGYMDDNQPIDGNFGYAPRNYNFPKAAYCSGRRDNGVGPVVELKNTVKEFHKAGIGVIMDVVYNHTMLTESSNFGQLVPGYFYRKDKDGNYSNAPNCGNELDTQKAMCRKYIVDSVLHWARDYNVDGFRFDVMSIIDKETMEEIASELKKLQKEKGRTVPYMLYGEGWETPIVTTSLNKTDRAEEKFLCTDKLKGVGYFSNANFTAGLKGDFDDEGYKHDRIGVLFGAGTAGCTAEKVTKFVRGIRANLNPEQIVNFTDCHDNMTLFNKIKRHERELYGKEWHKKETQTIKKNQLNREVNENSNKDKNDSTFSWIREFVRKINDRVNKSGIFEKLNTLFNSVRKLLNIKQRQMNRLDEMDKDVLSPEENKDRAEELNVIKQRYKLARAMLLTSQGACLTAEGTEGMRSKNKRKVEKCSKYDKMKKISDVDKYDADSGFSSDSINRIDWNRMIKHNDVAMYEKGLRRLRHKFKSFRLGTGSLINSYTHFQNKLLLDSDSRLISYTISDVKSLENDNKDCKYDSLAVIHNPSMHDLEVKLPADKWDVFVNEQKAGAEAIKRVGNGCVVIKARSTMVLGSEENIKDRQISLPESKLYLSREKMARDLYKAAAGCNKLAQLAVE